ncbi:MAG: hypothetical protein PHX60_01605 [Giesbergeria sp.]|uniref:DMT family transporter n=1 Tax=Giesbergeria sp. TaxID=2818473 RepID=UPI00260FAFFE|nr:hypothetical protein [Giesbergeria sp.]MDD2608375.1 hypothetical protein [Giesbergeria sp.]
MNNWLFAILAVCCNVGAQICMKFSIESNHSEKSIHWLTSLFSVWIIAAIALYGLSFILTIKVLQVNAMSTATPIMAGLTFCLTAIMGNFIFSELFSIQKGIGILFIFAGIFLLTQFKA